MCPSCQEAGILGVVAGMLGVVQASEAMKYILDIGESLVGHMFIFNALDMTVRIIKVKRILNVQYVAIILQLESL